MKTFFIQQVEQLNAGISHIEKKEKIVYANATGVTGELPRAGISRCASWELTLKKTLVVPRSALLSLIVEKFEW